MDKKIREGEKFCIYKDVQYPMQTLEIFFFMSLNPTLLLQIVDCIHL